MIKLFVLSRWLLVVLIFVRNLELIHLRESLHITCEGFTRFGPWIIIWTILRPQVHVRVLSASALWLFVYFVIINLVVYVKNCCTS